MKRVVKLFSIILITLLFSGCVKENVEITINNDKSVDFNMVVGIPKDVIEAQEATKNYYEENDIIKKLEENGFKVNKDNDETYYNYKISKHFDNIESISTNDDLNIDLFDLNKLSTNIYEAIQSNIDGYFSVVSEMPEEERNDYYKSSMDLKYVVNLPNKADLNNATSVENDGKRLIWNLKDFKEDTMNYEVSFTNKEAIIMIIGVSLVLMIIVLLIIVLIVKTIIKFKKKFKKKINNETEILDEIPKHKDKDESEIEIIE